ncbi:hypothetical protein [Plebeiibacterium sediminum]|uniref:Lipoprotein n=1 Tax=Plebeiibacterium sediminum TaxID=2992112 RepID=A0AAE3SG73_9BACT|nr:hypothetical protein [Plebeiobacterium sediminum]MCW3787817.1 hypothetical protein [Plebeiobacterium sediminum]
MKQLKSKSQMVIGFAWLFIYTTMLMSCTSSAPEKVSFYHWKSKAKDVFTKDGLKPQSIHKIYMHYFDVDQLNTLNHWEDGIYPVYPLTYVDEVYKSCDIVPVVFIVNKVLKDTDAKKLAKKIQKLVDEISLHHFGKIIHSLQIDCDWSSSTRYKYFELLNLLKKDYQLSCTIRLHQVKYQSKTGLPPVDKGVLMLYNVGDLSDFSANSILTEGIVSQYVNEDTDYPIPLDLALPLFSQTVLKNKNGEIKLIKGTDIQLFNQDQNHFKRESGHVYSVVRDTLYKGFYLSVEDQIKLEMSDADVVKKSYQIIKNSKINIDEVIFYHLDMALIQQNAFNDIIKNL